MTSMTCVYTECELAESFAATVVETCSGCPKLCVFGCKHECSAAWVTGLDQRVGMREGAEQRQRRSASESQDGRQREGAEQPSAPS